MQRRVRPPRPKLTWTLRRLFTKSELHSIAEIEKLIGELQEAREFLQSEGERVRRETERYTNLTQTASASVKIISDTVVGWREAGHQASWRLAIERAVATIRSSDPGELPRTRPDGSDHSGSPKARLAVTLAVIGQLEAKSFADCVAQAISDGILRTLARGALSRGPLQGASTDRRSSTYQSAATSAAAPSTRVGHAART
jgi:hypothetical protein